MVNGPTYGDGVCGPESRNLLATNLIMFHILLLPDNSEIYLLASHLFMH
jgi:hypothetical protein